MSKLVDKLKAEYHRYILKENNIKKKYLEVSLKQIRAFCNGKKFQTQLVNLARNGSTRFQITYTHPEEAILFTKLCEAKGLNCDYELYGFRYCCTVTGWA